MAANPSVPLGRIGVPEDIGKVLLFGFLFHNKKYFQIILFLADRSQSEILIGHIVTADGGGTLKSGLFADVWRLFNLLLRVDAAC